jgi:putative peptidoglycan lipid II flippase
VNLKKTTLNLSIINAAGVFLGFLFHILLGRRFGISWELDCLFAGLAIFALLGILNSFITSVFIPVFNEFKHEDEKDSFVFADVTIKWVALSALIITSLAWLSGDSIVRVVASGFREESVALTRDVIRILLIALIFSSITNILGRILNALYYFAVPAIAGFIHPVLNIAALYLLTPRFGITAIAISYVVSNILQMCILFIYITIKTPWRPTASIYHEKVPSLIKHSSKMTLSGFIWSIREIISRNIASHLAPGSIALLTYAEKFISIILQIAVSPAAKVFYSKVSELIAENNWLDIRELFERVTRANAVLVFFFSAGIIPFFVPLLNILFLGSKFTAHDISTIFQLVLIMLLYLAILSYETYLVQIVYAEKKANIVGFNNAAGVIVFSVSAYILTKLHGIYGIAASIIISQLVVCCLYYIFINKQLDTSIAKFIINSGKGLIISLSFVIFGISANKFLTSDMVEILCVLPVWSILFFMAIKVYMQKELEFIGIKAMFKNG